MMLFKGDKEDTTLEGTLQEFQEINDNNFKTNDEVQYYDMKDYEEAIYNGTKRALEDYYKEERERVEKEEKEKEESLTKDASATPSPSPTPQIDHIIVDNFPKGFDVNNFDYHTITDAIYNSQNEESAAVDFSTATDSTLYTVGTSAPVSSATGQSAVYLLEIRNIILIFCLMWLVIYIVSMLKRVAKRHGKGA